MCGIVGLYLKNPELESRIGELFKPMLIAMTDRGPDSAGFAIYGDEVGEGWVKLTLRHPDADYDWEALATRLKTELQLELSWFQNASVAVFKVHAEEATLREWLSEEAADVLILSVGQSIEILKEVGLPEKIAETSTSSTESQFATEVSRTIEPTTSTSLPPSHAPKQRVACELRRSDCDRKRAELMQRRPTSTRPSRGLVASNCGGALRSGTMNVRVKQPTASVAPHERNFWPGSSPNEHVRASCAGLPQ